MDSAPAVYVYLLRAWRDRTILRQFVRREFLGRYRGSLLGVVWTFLTPLLMLAVYTFVFVGVFKARWPGAEGAGGSAFALRLFAGLIVFNLFSEVIARAPTMVLEQPNLVKKVVFPLELLAFVALGSALVQFLIGATILLLGVAVFEQALSWQVLFLPVVVLPLLPMILGLAWLLNAFGVFLRDVAPLVSMGVSFLLFLSPVFYSVQSLAPQWQFWMRLNPLTPVMENLRGAVFSHVLPDWSTWWLTLAAGVLVAMVGASIFTVLRKGFADVV